MENNFTGGNVFTYEMPKKKEYIRADIFDAAMGVLSFVVTFLCVNYALNENYPTWIFAVLSLSFFSVVTAYIVIKQKSFPRAAIFPGFAFVLSAILMCVYGMALDYSLFLMVCTSLLYCTSLTKANKHSAGSYLYFVDVFSLTFFVPFKNLFLPYIGIVKALSEIKPKEKSGKLKKLLPVLTGVLFALPILFVAVTLLSEGDAAFEFVTSGLTEKAWKILEAFFKFFENIDILSLILSFFIAPYIYSVIFSFRHKQGCGKLGDFLKSRKTVSVAAMSGFLGVVCVAYIVYLFSQTAYFFSAFFGVVPEKLNLTLSQYAVRGFFEMTAVAVINLGLIASGAVFSVRTDGKIKPVIKGMLFFLCGFTMLLVITSASKIFLYIASYGLTEKRLFAFSGNAVLFMSFLLIVIRLFKEKFPYMKGITVFAFIVIFAVLFANPEKIIADYNVNAYISGAHKQIDIEQLYWFDDYVYISSLDKLIENEKDADKKKHFENLLGDRYGRELGLMRNRGSNTIYDMLYSQLVSANADIYYDYYYSTLRWTDEGTAFFEKEYGEEAESGYVILNTRKKITSVFYSSDILSGEFENADKTPLENGNAYELDGLFSAVMFTNNIKLVVTDESGDSHELLFFASYYEEYTDKDNETNSDGIADINRYRPIFIVEECEDGSFTAHQHKTEFDVTSVLQAQQVADAYFKK